MWVGMKRMDEARCGWVQLGEDRTGSKSRKVLFVSVSLLLVHPLIQIKLMLFMDTPY